MIDMFENRLLSIGSKETTVTLYSPTPQQLYDILILGLKFRKDSQSAGVSQRKSRLEVTGGSIFHGMWHANVLTGARVKRIGNDAKFITHAMGYMEMWYGASSTPDIRRYIGDPGARHLLVQVDSQPLAYARLFGRSGYKLVITKVGMRKLLYKTPE